MPLGGFATERRVEGRGQSFRVLWTPPTDEEGVVVFQHGIGSSAATFALVAEHLSRMNPKLGLLAFDARHHGLTEDMDRASANSIDLDLNTLVEDCEFVVKKVLESSTPTGALMLVGHSMGGTVVSTLAVTKKLPNVRGVVVMDAVEGYALESLRGMNRLLSLWPGHFGSLKEAVNWHVGRGHQIRNRESAEISVPPLLRQEATDRWVWRLDLSRTSRFWDSWFRNLDSLFLSAPAARLLVLAGTGRLDKALTVGQMQGKYQLALFNECGHYLHEDEPERAARLLADFWQRNGRPILIKPKFGQFRPS